MVIFVLAMTIQLVTLPLVHACGVLKVIASRDVLVPYSGKFSRVLIFAVFADQGESAKFYTSKLNLRYIASQRCHRYYRLLRTQRHRYYRLTLYVSL